MNTNFFIGCRWYTTPCKTVLNADEFVVEFLTSKHSIVAKVSDKCYFLSIDNISLSDIKCDFHFSRNYTSPKEFLSKLYDTFNSFLNTSIPFIERHFPHSTDDAIRRILELQEMKKEQFEIVSEPTTKSETTEAETATESKPETATVTVSREQRETAEKNVIEIVDENEYAKLEKELTELEDTHIDDIKKFKEKAVLNSSYGEATEPLRVYQFERLPGTLYKSLFKAIGLSETRKIPFIISNNMVFFNYNGTQYKYYPSQCKVFKKCGRKYQRINWKDFAEENNPDGQKQNRGRSPPLLLI